MAGKRTPKRDKDSGECGHDRQAFFLDCRPGPAIVAAGHCGTDRKTRATIAADDLGFHLNTSNWL
ncbi:hypothetical protein, partial [Paraburkholderia humisilvae]